MNFSTTFYQLISIWYMSSCLCFFSFNYVVNSHFSQYKIITQLFFRNSPEKSIQLPSFKKLSLMVENMGRINYGPHLHDFKGILGDVKVNKRIVSQENAWNIWTLPLNNTDKAKFTKLINKPG